MKPMILATICSILLAGCGADGEPAKPVFSTKTTVGYNSSTGPFNHTVFSVQVGG